MDNIPKVGIVVLNWNNYAATSRCLQSLQGIDYHNHVIYLVDNASSDGSMDRIVAEAGREDGIVFIRNSANLGFAAGCNKGMEKALADGCRYILLLNNDCIVAQKDFLGHAVAAAEADSRRGIIGGKILFWPETDRIWSTGGTISFWGAETHIGHREPDAGQYDAAADREFISGALMFIRREVVDAIGLLPDVYFFGKEEWEYSTRAVRAGFALRYVPEFSVQHEASNSHDWVDSTYIYNGTLSKVLYKKRNHPLPLFAVWWLVYALGATVFFYVKYGLMRKRYLQGVPPRVIRSAMLAALRDSLSLDRITGGTLDAYRARCNMTAGR